MLPDETNRVLNDSVVKLLIEDSICQDPTEIILKEMEPSIRYQIPWSRKQKFLVAVVCVTNLLANSAYSLIAPFFPAEAINKGVPNVFVGLVFSSYSLSMFLATPFYKKLIDLHGTFSLLTLGLLS
jgi:hypothetical protein